MNMNTLNLAIKSVADGIWLGIFHSDGCYDQVTQSRFRNLCNTLKLISSLSHTGWNLAENISLHSQKHINKYNDTPHSLSTDCSQFVMLISLLAETRGYCES